jgi:tetratricopeptide (TPR) repeat protein
MNGDLAEGVVPDLLREIYVGRRDGTLNLVRGKERQSLRFRRGHIVNAHTNVLEERLGEMLVRRGLLSEADLVRATETVVRDGRRLGEVLGEMGLIDASGLEDAVALHVHEMLARVFSWHEGTFDFEEQADGGPTEELTLKLSTGELILEAVQAVRDPDVVRYALGDMDRVLVPSSDPLLRFQKLTLSPADGFVLSRVDGVASAREIVQMIPLPAEQTLRSLFGLISTGVVEYVGVRRPRDASAPGHAAPKPTPVPPPPAPPPAPVAPPRVAPPPSAAPRSPVAPEPPAAPPSARPSAPPPSVPPSGVGPLDEKAAERRREILEAWEGLKTRTHFEVLGLSRSVGETEVKDAYFRLAKRFHPDVHHGASLGDLRDKLEEVFIRLGEAYDVLRDPRKRGDYEERLGRQRPRPSAPAAPPASSTPAFSPSAPSPPGPPVPEPSEPPRDAEQEAQLAEESIRRAAKLVEQEKYWDAIQLLVPAIDAVQGKARLRGQLLLARSKAKNPKWAKEAEEVLLMATRESPQAVDAWALLGELYAEKGLRTRAATMYRKALELQADHEEAAQYLAANAPAAELSEDDGGGGLLGRLFKKG